MSPRRFQPSLWLYFAGVLASVLLVAGAHLLLGPGRIAAVLSVHADEVSAIDVSCRIPNTLPWNRTEYRVTAREEIERIVAGIAVATAASPSHPQCKHNCLVELERAAGSLSFEATWECLNPDHGALIYVYSNGEWGLLYGTYSSSSLEPALASALTH